MSGPSARTWYPGVASRLQAPRPHGGPLDGSAYPLARHPGSGVPRLLPPPGLPDLPGPARRLDRLPGATHHQRGLAGHRAGRQAAPRHRLRRLPLRRLGVGRPGHRPGHADPDPPGPRRRRLDRRRRHPLPQAGGQGRLRRHLPRRRPLVEEAQDLAVRPQLGRARGRRAVADASRPLLLPAGALAAATARRGRPGYRSRTQLAAADWPGTWPRACPSGRSGWSATRRTSTRS